MSVKIKKVFDYHSRVQFKSDKPSLTAQDCKEECDINYIIESYVKRGVVPPVAQNYLDCTQVQDYESAMLLVAECNSMFEQLPSKTRDEFKTVQNYLSYVADENNLKDCIDRGFINKSTVNPDVLKKLYGEVLEVDTPLPQKAVSEPVNGAGENVSANS